MLLLDEFPVVVEIAVAWGDMDACRHVNNTVYFRYFETARLEYFRRLDWHGPDREQDLGPILAATEARFRKPLTYPDTVTVGVRVPSLEADRFTMEYRLVSQRLQAVAAEGRGTIVTYDYRQAQKVPIPDLLRQRIAELEATVGRS